MPTQPVFDVAFWLQVMADARRTIFCSPADEDLVRAAVERRGIGGLITVTPSPAIKPGQLYLADDGAAERLLRQACRYTPMTDPVARTGQPCSGSPDPLPQPAPGRNTQMSTITLDLDQLRLQHGSHHDRNAGVCLLEAVAWWAGESHTDHPACVSRVLANFGISLNDRFDTERRQELKRFIPLLPGTAGDGQEEARSYLALDWLIRTYTPTWLDLAGLTSEAAELRALRRIADLAAAKAAGPVVQAARTKAAAAWDAAGAAAWDAAGAAAWDAAWAAARDAAGAAAGDAARAAAWDAAWAAAGDAAWDAAGAAAGDAARAAAWDAAWDAAGAAARAAARDAARDALKPTVDQLQQSVIALFESMINPAAGNTGAK